MSFHHDLQRGLLAESRAKEAIAKYRPDWTYFNHGYVAKGFDLAFEKDDAVLLFEVKQDFQFKETGNIAVELRSRGKDSGLTTTQSPLWVYVLDEDIFIIRKETLLKLTEKGQHVRGGDEEFVDGEWRPSSEISLIKVQDFVKYAKLINRKKPSIDYSQWKTQEFVDLLDE